MKDLSHLEQRFRHKAIYKELGEIRDKIATTTDPEEKEELIAYEDQIREFSVKLIEQVKARDEDAFDRLMNIKDMRNFLHYYTYHIREYHKFRYGKQNVLHEVRFQIFYHVSRNYRMYNEPHEISLLITSMRNWIKPKVSGALATTYSPKNDEKLESCFLEETEVDDSVIIVRDLVERYLDEEEKQVFELRFFQERGFVEIGREMGFSKDTAQRKYKKSLAKIEKIISKEL